MSKERLNELWNKVKHIGTIDQFDDERMMALGSVFGEMRAEIEELEQQNSRYRELLKKMNDKRFEKEEVDGHEFILECFKALNVFQALDGGIGMINITPCAECGIWDNFDTMKIIRNELYCDECYEELTSESEESE